MKKKLYQQQLQLNTFQKEINELENFKEEPTPDISELEENLKVK